MEVLVTCVASLARQMSRAQLLQNQQGEADQAKHQFQESDFERTQVSQSADSISAAPETDDT